MSDLRFILIQSSASILHFVFLPPPPLPPPPPPPPLPLPPPPLFAGRELAGVVPPPPPLPLPPVAAGFGGALGFAAGVGEGEGDAPDISAAMYDGGGAANKGGDGGGEDAGIEGVGVGGLRLATAWELRLGGEAARMLACTYGRSTVMLDGTAAGGVVVVVAAGIAVAAAAAARCLKV